MRRRRRAEAHAERCWRRGRVRKNPARRVKSDSARAVASNLCLFLPRRRRFCRRAARHTHLQRECRMTLHFSFFATDLTLCRQKQLYSRASAAAWDRVHFSPCRLFCPFSNNDQRDVKTFPTQTISGTGRYAAATSFASQLAVGCTRCLHLAR
jgi:hypothetical protein